MKVHDLSPAPGSKRHSKRVARGIAGKGGKTAGRGMKGQKARSKVRAGFEGGQMPLQRRVPKFGFTNINRKEYAGINLDKLQELVDNKKITDTVSLEILVANGVVGKNDLVKILGRGELKATLNVTVHKFTATAKAAIEAAGGSMVTIDRLAK